MDKDTIIISWRGPSQFTTDNSVQLAEVSQRLSKEEALQVYQHLTEYLLDFAKHTDINNTDASQKNQS